MSRRVRYKPVYDLLRQFRRAHPDCHVQLRWDSTPRYSGWCMRRADGSGYIIGLHRSLTCSHACDVLVHELAHAVSWTADDGGRVHGPQFGLAYARLYTLLMEERDGS